MEITKDEACTGCVFYKWNDHITCKVIPIINGNTCPCMSCLIKSMCTDTCNAFFTYKDKEFDEEWGKRILTYAKDA